MNWRLLDMETAGKLYRDYMTADFPPTELKPFTAIHRMMDAGAYEPYGVYDEAGELCAYAYLALMGRTPLLDYFAVLPHKRARGWGTRLMAELREQYRGRADFICIESEYPPAAPDPETATRRLDFYRRAGALQSRVSSSIWGVQYCNFALPVELFAPTDAAVQAALTSIYHAMVPDEAYRRNVHIRTE